MLVTDETVCDIGIVTFQYHYNQTINKKKQYKIFNMI